MADVVRYVPGVGMAQGEGNRDTPIFRGNSSTSDFFVDGVRDDVAVLPRPLQRRPGRGAQGTERDDLRPRRRRRRHQPRHPPGRLGPVARGRLQVGSWGNRRVTADVGAGVNETRGRARDRRCTRTPTSTATASTLERYGFNPTLAFRARAAHDAARRLRVLPRRPRGRSRHPLVRRPAGRHRPADLLRQSATQSTADATVNMLSAPLEHRFGRAGHAAQPVRASPTTTSSTRTSSRAR